LLHRNNWNQKYIKLFHGPIHGVVNVAKCTASNRAVNCYADHSILCY